MVFDKNKGRIVIRKGGYRPTGYTVYRVYPTGGEQVLEWFSKKSDAKTFVKNYKAGRIKSRFEFES